MSWAAAFAEAVLPDIPALPAADRIAVQRRVTSFLVSQPALAPWHLRMAIRTIGAAFRAAARLRHPRRGFAGLDPADRRRFIEDWADRSCAARSFVRLHRSLALLAYFEDPAVLAAMGCPDREGWRDGKRLERASRVPAT